MVRAKTVKNLGPSRKNPTDKLVIIRAKITQRKQLVHTTTVHPCQWAKVFRAVQNTQRHCEQPVTIERGQTQYCLNRDNTDILRQPLQEDTQCCTLLFAWKWTVGVWSKLVALHLKRGPREEPPPTNTHTGLHKQVKPYPYPSQLCHQVSGPTNQNPLISSCRLEVGGRRTRGWLTSNLSRGAALPHFTGGVPQ